MIYSNNVYELRKENKISQKKMACDLGISRRSVGQIENNEQFPSLETAYRIAAYFDCTITDVFPIKCNEELTSIKKYKEVRHDA